MAAPRRPRRRPATVARGGRRRPPRHGSDAGKRGARDRAGGDRRGRRAPRARRAIARRLEPGSGSDNLLPVPAGSRRQEREAAMAGITLEAIMLGTVGVLLLVTIFMMGMIVAQLRAMRRQVEEARVQLGRMDWGALL